MQKKVQSFHLYRFSFELITEDEMKQSASKQNPDQAPGKKSKKGVDQPDTAEEATVDEANIFGGEISESDEVLMIQLEVLYNFYKTFFVRFCSLRRTCTILVTLTWTMTATPWAAQQLLLGPGGRQLPPRCKSSRRPGPRLRVEPLDRLSFPVPCLVVQSRRNTSRRKPKG